jgi:hypothetical protein
MTSEGDRNNNDAGSASPTNLSTLRSAQRIHIIGGPGTGKSSLAIGLGRLFDLPVHSLDDVAFEGSSFRERSWNARAAEVEGIAVRERWITEGIFVGWTKPLLERTSVIIWLDYSSWPGATYRLVVRFAREAIREIFRRRGTERFFRVKDYQRNFRQLMTVLRTSRDFWLPPADGHRYPVTRDEIEGAVAPYPAKVIRIRRRADARALVGNVGRARHRTGGGSAGSAIHS